MLMTDWSSAASTPEEPPVKSFLPKSSVICSSRWNIALCTMGKQDGSESVVKCMLYSGWQFRCAMWVIKRCYYLLKAIKSQFPLILFCHFFSLAIFSSHENTHWISFVSGFSKTLKSLFNKRTTQRNNDEGEREMAWNHGTTELNGTYFLRESFFIF